MQIKKRDGRLVDFDKNKIIVAIEKAMHSPQGKFIKNQAKEIANIIEDEKLNSVSKIESRVYFLLTEKDNAETAKAYEAYRAVQAFRHTNNTSDDAILGLINGTNKEAINENSNKSAYVAATQRDLIAGEVSKDIVRRKLLPQDLVEAHDKGILHLHDMDYLLQHIHNCDLLNIPDMLRNGTVINGSAIETPKSFQTACTITTQIIACCASNQLGGQSINGIDEMLAPYLFKTYKKYLKFFADEKDAELLAERMMKKELSDGVQTLQYQINTLMTTNGQTPFVTFALNFNPDGKYAKYAALICEEILKQRLKGIKNSDGVYTTPVFPKLVYCLDEHNAKEGSKYYYLTKLAAECTAKRMYPDYVSAKVMKARYDGQVWFPMGCRSFLSLWKNEKGEYQFDGRFNQGVVSVNPVRCAILAKGDINKFYEYLDKALELCHKALIYKTNNLKGTKSDIAPILWQHGALARLKPGETIDKLLYGGYSTSSLGFIGIYETVKLLTGESHSKHQDLALEICQYMRDKCEQWKKEDNVAYGLYGTPAESLCYTFAKKLKKEFGVIKDVTDKGYLTNSFHYDVREPVDAFTKLEFEAPFHAIASGGCLSYIEMPSMTNNVKAVEQIINYIYNNIQYAEFNTKLDYCYNCGYKGEIEFKNGDWECPQCGNRDHSKLVVTRRTCGYLGSNFWNEGRTKEITSRVLHLDDN